MTTPELPPLPPLPPVTAKTDASVRHFIGALFDAFAARERILLARIAEQDHVIAIARQNAELLTGYWKAAVAEVKALRAEMKAHGIPPEGDDDVDGW